MDKKKCRLCQRDLAETEVGTCYPCNQKARQKYKSTSTNQHSSTRHTNTSFLKEIGFESTGQLIFASIFAIGVYLWLSSDDSDSNPMPRGNSDLEDTRLHCAHTAGKIIRNQAPMEDSGTYRIKLFEHCMESNGH